MEFRRTPVVADVTPAADGSTTVDLPVNPISHLIVTIKALNESAKVTTAQLLGAVENLEVLKFGAAQAAIRAADLYALNCVLIGKEPWQENVTDLDNATRMVTLIMPFGRKLFDPTECLPATIRGELTFRYTVDIADTGYDGLIMQVEAVELLGAKPTRHLKYVTATATPSATGNMDVELPIGNKYVGILLWGTTVPTGTAWTATIEQVTLFVDNVEKYYREAYWESLHGDLIRKCAPANAFAEQFHTENTNATYAQNADTSAEEQDDTTISNYSYMDFDPTGDESYMLESRGLSDLALRINAGDTNALRVISIEQAPTEDNPGNPGHGASAPPPPPPPAASGAPAPSNAAPTPSWQQE